VFDDDALEWGIGGAALLVFARGSSTISRRSDHEGSAATRQGPPGTDDDRDREGAGDDRAAVVVVALLDRGDAWTRLGAVTLIAASTERLERPGRAARPSAEAFMVLMVVLASPAGSAPAGRRAASRCWCGAVLVLLPDLREWAMLGDAGSNLLGFTWGSCWRARCPPGRRGRRPPSPSHSTWSPRR
jgi:hypothetical protein